MALFVKAKRVSGPLDDRVKARLLSSDRSQMSSSGSEHEASDHCCLCGLVHAFLELDEPHPSEFNSDDDEDGDVSFYSHAAEKVRDLLDHPTRPVLDIYSAVMEAEESLAGLTSRGSSGYKRAVTAKLRESGYDAGLCKARWESSGGLVAGGHEYIDVNAIGDKEDDRYIVDLGFGAQFEVARATSEYEKLAAMLPRVMIARAEAVKQVVRIMAEAAKRSLKRTGLSLPPWRKRRYMMAKWLGPYRRTLNPVPLSSVSTVAGRGEIERRAVGHCGSRDKLARI